MVISSPGIYIFSRHNSVWWPNNINTMRTVMSKAFCRHFSIFRKFWIEMLTSTALIHSSEVIDWIQIEWWPTSTFIPPRRFRRKFKFPSWHFGHRPCRRLIYIPTLSCHIPFFAPPPISPKKCGFYRPAVYCSITHTSQWRLNLSLNFPPSPPPPCSMCCYRCDAGNVFSLFASDR